MIGGLDGAHVRVGLADLPDGAVVRTIGSVPNIGDHIVLAVALALPVACSGTLPPEASLVPADPPPERLRVAEDAVRECKIESSA